MRSVDKTVDNLITGNCVKSESDYGKRRFESSSSAEIEFMELDTLLL